MPDSEARYDQIHECDVEMKKIDRDAAELQRALDAILSDFALKYPNADTNSLSEDFSARLSDTVNDLQGPAWRRKCRLEGEIGDIEWEDLNRSRPAVL